MRRRFRRGLQRALEFTLVVLMVALALVVVFGVVFRKLGASLVWYDEVASILLAWLTFYGAALAALHRAHIGFPKLVDGLGPTLRRPLILLGEAFVLLFFMVTAWAGWRVFGILGGEMLVSLPWVPQRLTQSVIPIGACLFIVAELVTLPEVWAGGDGSGGDGSGGDRAGFDRAGDGGFEPSEGEAAGLGGPS